MMLHSFYYHYQDIYNVLEWIVETEVCTPLQFDDAQAPGEWCLQALTLLREKQQLMRKISQALGQDTMYRITERIIRPQLSRLLPDPDAVDSATHSLALDMPHSARLTVSLRAGHRSMWRRARSSFERCF